jgi:hypothetical protein
MRSLRAIITPHRHGPERMGRSPAGVAERIFTLDEAYQAALGSNEVVKIAE